MSVVDLPNPILVLPPVAGKMSVVDMPNPILVLPPVTGKMSVVDMPLSLVSWTLPDGAACLAMGDDAGNVRPST